MADFKKNETVMHQGNEMLVVNVSQWNIPNTMDVMQVKDYPPTKFTEVALYSPAIGVIKLFI